jgi:hypothetical protein
MMITNSELERKWKEVVTVLKLHRVSQELRSLLRDLIPLLILNQKFHIHIGPISNASGVTRF